MSRVQSVPPPTTELKSSSIKKKKKNPNWKWFGNQWVQLAPTLFLFYKGEKKSRGAASPDLQPNLQDHTRLGSSRHERGTLARRRELGTSGRGRPGASISKTGDGPKSRFFKVLPPNHPEVPVSSRAALTILYFISSLFRPTVSFLLPCEL